MKINLDSQENLEIICKRCVIVLGWVPDSNNVIVGVKYNEEETLIEKHPLEVKP